MTTKIISTFIRKSNGEKTVEGTSAFSDVLRLYGDMAANEEASEFFKLYSIEERDPTQKEIEILGE